MGASIYKNKKPAIIFLIPAFLFMIVYLYYPFLQNIWNSFQNIRQLGSSGEGFLDPWYSNYVEMFHDEVVWISLKNTLIMMLVTLVGQVGIAIVLALMVDNITHGKHFYKTVYFFPIVISATALGLLFNLIFLYDKGMLNQILEKLGKVGLTDWKGEGIALFTMMLPVMWQYVGFYFVILITGLNNISDELYEAARIDGATPRQILFKITVPLLKPTILLTTITSTNGTLQLFDESVNLTDGGPANASITMSHYIYNMSFKYVPNFGYAAAMSFFILILVAILAFIQMKVGDKRD